MKVLQLEADLRAAKDKARTLIEATSRKCADHVVKPATATDPAILGRQMSAEERAEIDASLKDAEGIQKRIDGAASDAALLARLDQISGGNATAIATRPPAAHPGRRTVGAQFVASEEYRQFIANGQHRVSGGWSSPGVECNDPGMSLRATTITEDPAVGGALIIPDYQPGIHMLGFQRIVVADLCAPGTTNSNLVSYMKELAFTNAADFVKEGIAKPESAITFSAATASVKKVAHFLPVSEEMLEDVAQIQSVIDARLRLGLDLKEEDGLLNGDGIDPHLLGFHHQPGLTPAHPMGTDSIADAMLKQITAIATTTFIYPDGFVMNPNDWMIVQLTKTTQGLYYGSGPFAPPQPPMLWGLPGAVTPAEAAGIALVGAFRTQSQIFRRGGVRVEMTNSHLDFFTKNLVAIRGEERLAFAVYRPASFGEVTGIA
jgi:HK97 family phage major capsid protein